MTLSLLFWMLMLLWLVFEAWSRNWTLTRDSARPIGGSVLLFLLLLVLGWGVFGAPIR